MKLYFKKIGEGKPLFILHGLFGLGDNWMTLARKYSDKGFSCYLIDQRNHGRSPHSKQFNYQLMADDLSKLVKSEHLEKVDIIGHSMGGKTAMFFAQLFPALIRKLIVADIAPRAYSPHHVHVIAALKSLDTEKISSRKDAEARLRASLTDEATVQFLLKSLFWNEDGKLAWRFNLPVLSKEMDAVGEALPQTPAVKTPTLFIRGEKSGYISVEDEQEIQKIFLHAKFETIAGAGHWIHADKPEDFFLTTIRFLNE
jgi:esterase